MTSMTNGVKPNLNLLVLQSRTLFLLCTVLALILTGCSVPNHEKVWFSYTRFDQGCDNLANCSKLTDEAAASQYYRSIGAEDYNGNPYFNLEQWKQTFGYYDSTVVRAVYGNKLDLQFGRDMNCWQPADYQVACYVSNYGPPPFTGGRENELWEQIALPTGVFDAVEGDIHKSFGTVAMVYSSGGGVYKDHVAFYAFGKADADGNSPLIRSVALDGEGPKTVPGMCMNCHSGGDHGDAYHQDNFLPFDVQSFSFNAGYISDSGYFHDVPTDFNLDNQQEAFRQLNALVLKTNPTPAIRNLINGLYPDGVNTPGATVPDDTYIPAGWDIDKQSRNLYRNVYRKYCRMCHVAQKGYVVNNQFVSLAFESLDEFKTKCLMVRDLVYSHSMPNSEVPYGAFQSGNPFPVARFPGFWTDGVAQSDLQDFVGGRDCY